jgi:transposase
MASKRHKPEEIVSKLRQIEVLVGQGMARIDAIREVRITEQTFYRWRKQYGGMGTAQSYCQKLCMDWSCGRGVALQS